MDAELTAGILDALSRFSWLHLNDHANASLNLDGFNNEVGSLSGGGASGGGGTGAAEQAQPEQAIDTNVIDVTGGDIVSQEIRIVISDDSGNDFIDTVGARLESRKSDGAF